MHAGALGGAAGRARARRCCARSSPCGRALDLDSGRLAQAALELRQALAAAVAELRGEGRQDLVLRVDELEQLSDGVAGAGASACSRRRGPAGTGEPSAGARRASCWPTPSGGWRRRCGHASSASNLNGAMQPTATAIGTWSGGRFMRFGEPLRGRAPARAVPPRRGHRHGDHRRRLRRRRGRSRCSARARGRERDRYCLVGAIGHDFYEGERDGPKGFPRFTDPRLRGPARYADYMRMATERSLERCGIDRFDLLLLHNPDRSATPAGGLGGDAGAARGRASPRRSASPRARPTASRST